MKVLYAGVYREFGGWAQATRDAILALDSSGVEIVCRPIVFSRRHTKFLPKRIAELENKSAAGCDTIIQHILPNLMEYCGYLRNVGVYYSETTTIRPSNWPERLNFMDSLWVSNRYMEEAARNSYVTPPISVIPCSTDINKFQRSYKPLPIRPYDNAFLFYSISSTITRKNLEALIKAFHIEFEPYEPVELVVKVHSEEKNYKQNFMHFLRQIKENLKLKKTRYKNEILITEDLSEEDLMRLHATCDCFVSSSYCEAACLPALDAMGMGKTPIVPSWGGFLEYIDDTVGSLIPVKMGPAFGGNGSFDFMYTAEEDWAEIDIRALGKSMREVYENEELRLKKRNAGKEKVYQFDYKTIGNLMKKALEYEPARPKVNNRDSKQ